MPVGVYERTLTDPDVRFVEKFDIIPGGCWPWRKPGTNGYGTFHLPPVGGRKRVTTAHRYMWEMVVGPIPSGMVIDHLCRNKACVNPMHLEVVTYSVNALRGVGVGGRGIYQTECARGHDASVHFKTRPDGERYCYACAQMLARERAQRAKESA